MIPRRERLWLPFKLRKSIVEKTLGKAKEGIEKKFSLTLEKLLYLLEEILIIGIGKLLFGVR